jgi:curved DNA-binding protein CbpA
MGSDEDLYGVLGVAAGASSEAVRAAYRARVRENHSDGKLLNPEEQARADARTAALNRAWHVLSDPGRRRQYDEQREIDALLRRAPGQAAARGDAATAPGAAGPRTAPHRSSPSIHASHLLRSRILALPGLHWEREACDGFEWTLAAKTLLARYLVALHYDESADPDVARRFVSAARAAAESRKARTRHYLFVLMYDRVDQVEQVRAACAHFSATEEGKGCGIVLYEASRARAVLCGPAPSDDKTKSLVAALGV